MSDVFGIKREDILRGFPGQRAQTALFAIESKAALLAERSRRELDVSFRDSRAVGGVEDAWFEALASHRLATCPPTIQDIERFARDWEPLVPADDVIRAHIIYRLQQKYPVSYQFLPGIRNALQIESAGVQAAYASEFGHALREDLDRRVTPIERIRWRWVSIQQRIDSLLPFWFAFGLTFAGSVGTTTLALPIAVARVGIWPAIGIIVFLGLVNLVTIAAMVESVSRNGEFQLGTGNLGRLVDRHLGRPATQVFVIAALLATALTLTSRYTGFGTTMSAAVGIPAELWVLGLFAVQVLLLWRGSHTSTVAIAFIAGLAIVLLLLALIVVTLPHFSLAALTAPPPASITTGRDGLAVMIAISISLFARHVAMGTTAKVVLARDPSGVSLLSGVSLGLLASTVLHIAWIVVVNGSVSAVSLAETSGTALVPLSEEVGDAADLLGALFTLLALGFGSLIISHSLFVAVEEWLPRPHMARTVRSGEGLTSPDPRAALRRLPAFALALAPVLTVFAIVEVQIRLGRESFTRPLELLAILTGPIIAAIIPMLLVRATRNQGDRLPGRVIEFVGAWPTVWAVWAGALLLLAWIGLLAWFGSIRGILSLLVGGVCLRTLGIALSRDSLKRGTTVELAVDKRPGGRSYVQVMTNGRPAEAMIRLIYPNRTDAVDDYRCPIPRVDHLERIEVELAGSTKWLSLWIYRLLDHDIPVSYPAEVTILGGPAGTISRHIASGSPERLAWNDGGRQIAIDPAGVKGSGSMRQQAMPIATAFSPPGSVTRKQQGGPLPPGG